MTAQRAYAVAGLSFVALMFSSVAVFVFTLVLKPMQLEMGWSRGALSLAPALFFLMNGVSAFFAGRMLERLGARLTLTLCLTVITIASFLVGFVTQLWQLYVLFGLLFPIGSAGAIFVVVSVLISRSFAARRGVILSVVSTGFSFGQLLAVPAFSVIILVYGWRLAYLPLGAVLAAITVGAVMMVRGEPAADRAIADPPKTEEVGRSVGVESLREALRAPIFWLVAVSYFACGFTDFLVTTQLPSYASDLGFYPQSGALALSVIGGANIAGLVVMGRFSDSFSPTLALAVTYLTRLASIPVLIMVHNVYTLYVFSFAFGFTFFTTAPLTANLVRQSFGEKKMGSVFGALGLVHSLGGGPGAYIGGFMYDLTGSYLQAFEIGFVILLLGTASAFLARLRLGGKMENQGAPLLADVH